MSEDEELTETQKRLGRYIKKIGLENLSLDSFDKSIKLARYLTELDDMECLNLFSRMLKRTAKEHGNEITSELIEPDLAGIAGDQDEATTIGSESGFTVGR